MIAPVKKVHKQSSGLREALQKEMLALATSAFGLIAALAWNEFIKELVTTTIKPLIGEGSGLISLLIYAVIVTVLAVLVTYNLTKLYKQD